MTGHGRWGSVGTGVGSGGTEGSAGVPVGGAVGAGGSDGVGARVGGFVVAGGAVGAEVGATSGDDVRGLEVPGGVANELLLAGGLGDAAAPLVGLASGDAVAPGGSGGC